jgi:beta-mannosidase
MDNGLSFYFKVNNIPIFMKGTNWIPAHILPEKSANEMRVKSLLQAARDAKMNMIRVWGGGVYESDYFYDLADKYGIFIWQDMMFACAMYPASDNFLHNVRMEVKQQIRRIQHHPSIALFATNNENEVALRQNWYGTNAEFDKYAQDYVNLYIKTVVDEIRKIDKTRIVLVSSPSNGNWNKDKDPYGISTDPQSQHFGDIHYYPLNTNSWKSSTFHQPRFASEYGFQSYPHGWKDVARKNDSIVDLISHRQHHPLNSTLIIYLVQENLNVDFSALEWHDQVYLSQISQAIALKTETEVYRSGRGNFMNTMGALYWQLNDVWIAPSWSSIEFNGNYKIIHYWIRDIFASQSIITQFNMLRKLVIYGVSDEINVANKSMTVKMNVYKWDGLSVKDVREWKFDMISNAVTPVVTFDLYQYMHDMNFNVYDYFMLFHLYDNSDDSYVVAKNFIFPGDYQNLNNVNDPGIEIRLSSNRCEKSEHRVTIEIKIKSPAIFIFITLDHEFIKQYQLSNNGFIQVDPIQTIQMTFKNPECKWTVVKEELNVKTLNHFLKN